jgi:hypothetical protein
MVVLAIATAVGSALGAFARERGPRVEVACPKAPTVATIGQVGVLVYELHITNFDVVPLTLTRVEVFANEVGGAPLGRLSDKDLVAAMVRVGAKSGPTDAAKDPSAPDTRVIEPGGRNVLFLWIGLAANHAAPTSLRHRMVFAAAGEGAPTEVTLEDFGVAVEGTPVPVLSAPFRGGIWVAGDGPANTSNHRRSIFAIDGAIYSPERFAIDWVKVGPNGDSHHDGTAANENWWGFGEPVLAVADGGITEVVDGIPDNVPRKLPPVTLDNIVGNHVILKISAQRYVTYAHLKNGSIQVKLHDHVKQGAVLGLLGNSGNTTGAHLHLQMTDGSSVLESEGVPFVFPGFTYLGPGADYEVDKHASVPWKNSMPPGDAVIEFGVGK